ncbi:MlaD family protein [Patulibacter defluvii]|uniref:MlaD family protein n=1 Tax=Patulibacter defluvii TaxID=3095358 RepID=UPI002A74F718|nr:MlaD family protein [Patulibacter sp. DM4]
MPLTALRLRGALAVVVVLAAVLLAWQRPNPFSSDRTVRVALADATTLRTGSEVRVAGTAAGRVTAIERAGDHALVTMRVARDAGPIRRDARVELWPRLVFEGNAYLELRPGSADQPPLGERVIPVARTIAYVPVDRALRLADGPTRAAIRGGARGLAAAGDRRTTRAVGRTLERLPPLLGRVRRVADAVRGPAGAGDPDPTARGASLRRAVRGLARTGNAVAIRQADLRPLIDDAERTAAALHGPDGAALRATIAALPETLRAVRRGSAAADGTLARLDGLTRDLDPGLGDVAPTVRAARPVLRRAGRAATAATPLVRDGRAALERAAAAAPDARALVARTAPTLGVLDRSLLPALAKPTPTLKLPSYLAFLNMFAGGGGASRYFQPSDPSNGLQQGEGHFMRFQIRFLTGLGLPLPPCATITGLSPDLGKLLSGLELCTP